MTFASPGLLLLLLVAPLLGVLLWRDIQSRRARLARLVSLGLSESLVEPSARGRTVARVLAVFAYVVVVTAAAGPQMGGTTTLLPQRGLDILFAFDVSRSMRSRDVQPDRLERAKAELSASLGRFADHRVGLVAFAGTAFVQCPLTTDKEAVRLFLGDLRPEVVPQGGTALGAGLEVALNQFLAEEEANPDAKSAGRVLVVFTDGEDHEGGIESVGEKLKAAGVTTLLLGVGSTLGEPIPVVDGAGVVTGYVKDRQGQTVVTRMNPEALSQVATAVGGAFVDATSKPDLGLTDVEAKVQTLEKRELQARTRVEREDRGALLALLALLLLSVAVLWPERRRRTT
jgi:Ca-activated chloride channel family protein